MDYTNLKERMEKSIGAFKEKLSEIRAGRANPAILNKVKIDYYGTPTPINQVAGVSVPEARLIVIQPWDVSVLKDIEKAILASDIGLNPNNDGKQTPMRQVHPVFIAQHATGCCCRGCLERIHGIKKGHELSSEEIEYVVNTLMLWIQREMSKD